MLNEQFVEDYIKEFNPSHKFMLIGAHKCKELSELLKSLYDQGILSRNAIGIPDRESYMPKWIYCYTLTKLGKDML